MKCAISFAATIVFSTSLNIAAQPAVLPTAAQTLVVEGWDSYCDSGTVTIANPTDSSFSAVMTRSKVNETADLWPSAFVTGKVNSSVFTGVERFIITHKTSKIPSTADGIAFYIAPVDADGIVITSHDTYGGFRAVLTPTYLGADQVDTLTLSDFYLDWWMALDSGFKYTVSGSDTLCTLADNPSYLKGCSGIAFTIENDNSIGPDTLDFAVKKIEVVRAASGIEVPLNSTKFSKTFVTATTKNSISVNVPFAGNYELSIMNSCGRIVERTNALLVANNQNVIAISNRTSGVYFVELKGCGINVTEKVIIN